MKKVVVVAVLAVLAVMAGAVATADAHTLSKYRAANAAYDGVERHAIN